MEPYVLIGLFWIGVSVVWGLVARRKGRSFLAIFALSIFVTPIVGMIVALLLQPTDAAKMSVAAGGAVGSVGPVPCPYCKEQIRADAIVCKHCGKDVEPALPSIEKAKEEASALAQQEAEAQRIAAEKESVRRAEARAAFFKRKSVRLSIAGLVVLVIVGVAISVFVRINGDSVIEGKIQEKIAWVNDWSERIKTCTDGLPETAGIHDVSVSEDDSVVTFVLDLGHDPSFLDCLDSSFLTLTVVTEDINGERLVLANPDSELSGRYYGINNQITDNTKLANYGSFEVRADGPDVYFGTDGAHGGPWEVTITKLPGFGGGAP